MIGVFGGTFDPIHYGHLRPLWEVKQAVQLDQVRLIPCFIPPHRDAPGATAEQRLQMLQLAADEIQGLQIDTRELDRGGRSYMVDTLQSLRDELEQEVPLCLILGSDAYAGLPSWHQWQRLSELAHIIVMRRPGTAALGETLTQWQTPRLAADVQTLTTRPAGCILLQDVTQLDISATMIRAEINAGRDVRFLTPDPVSAYIARHNLYRNE